MSDPYVQLYLVVAVFATFVRGDNFTERYAKMGTTSSNKFQTRQHRLLTFNTDPDGEISIEMQFAVPFIKIPVTKAMDAGKGAIANFNVASLVVSGIIVLVTGFVLPAIVKFVDQKVMPMSVLQDFQRDGKSEPTTEWWRILTLMDEALMEYNIDTTSCMQRAICWTVKSTTNKISNGRATSKDIIVDELISNEWVHKAFIGTPIESAINDGNDGINCSKKYSACKITQKTLATFVKQFTNAINTT